MAPALCHENANVPVAPKALLGAGRVHLLVRQSRLRIGTVRADRTRARPRDPCKSGSPLARSRHAPHKEDDIAIYDVIVAQSASLPRY